MQMPQPMPCGLHSGLPIGVALRDEAILVVAVAVALAAAEARNVAQHFGMARGELVGGASDRRRPRGRELHHRERRQRAVVPLTFAGRGAGTRLTSRQVSPDAGAEPPQPAIG